MIISTSLLDKRKTLEISYRDLLRIFRLLSGEDIAPKNVKLKTSNDLDILIFASQETKERIEIEVEEYT